MLNAGQAIKAVKKPEFFFENPPGMGLIKKKFKNPA